MVKTIFIRELQQLVLSIRLHIALVLVIITYSISTISFISEYKELKSNNFKASKAQIEYMESQAESNLSKFAIRSKKHFISPRDNSFLSDCKENLIPNVITYSAYNVFGFQISGGSNNPFLFENSKINMEFIIILFFSFLALVFSFDSISGEKENKSLALLASNSVSRLQVLLGKYLATIVVLSLFALLGLVISLTILMISPEIQINRLVFIELIIFFFFTILFISCLSSIGILSSVITKNPNISLLIGITFWLFFLFILPNISILLSSRLYKIDKLSTVHERTKTERDKIEASYPEGKWSSSGGNPFYKRHEIRANMQMDFMLNRKKHFDNWYNQLFNQYKKVRGVNLISPFATFEYGTEILLDGGFTRFEKNWKHMHIYQEQLLQFFKEKDQSDPKSPHWYNPFEDYSTTRKPCNFDEVPRYSERMTSFKNRIKNMAKPIILLLTYTIVFMIVSYMLFIKYDVR